MKNLQKAQKETKEFEKRVMKNNQKTREGKYGYSHPVEPISGYNTNNRNLSSKKKELKSKPKMQRLGILVIAFIIIFYIIIRILN